MNLRTLDRGARADPSLIARRRAVEWQSGTSGVVVDAPGEKVVSWLGIAHARRRRPSSNELAALGPARDVLVVCGVIPPDEGDISDVDVEQMKSTGPGSHPSRAATACA